MAGKRKKTTDEPKAEENAEATLSAESAIEEQPMIPEEEGEGEHEEEEVESENSIPEEPNNSDGPDEEGQSEGEAEEKQLADVLYEAFLELELEKQKLDQEKASLEKIAAEIRAIIYKPIKHNDNGTFEIPGEFKDPEGFRKKLDAISNFAGHALDYVIRLEKTRLKYNFPMGETPEQLTGVPEVEEPQPKPQQPVNVNVAQPVQKSGFWDSRIAKVQFEAYKLQLEAEKEANKHPIVSSEKVGDVLEFGRQIIPAINRVKAWLPGAIAGFRFFKTEERYFVRHEELATYLGQALGTTLTAFVSAYVEYKKSVIDGRKVSLTKSFARIVEAQSGGMAPLVQKGGTFMGKGAELGPGGFKERH